MAENQEDIILNIEINYKDAIKGIAEYTLAIEDNKKTQDSLKTALKEQRISQEEYAKSMAATKAQIDFNKDAIRVLTKEIQTNLKIDNEKVGSLNKLKAQLSLNTVAYAKLSDAEKVATSGIELQRSITEISAKLKEEEAVLGDHRRNVGDYEIATRSLRSELKEYTDQLAEMILQGKQGTPEFEALRLKVGELKDAFSDAGQTIKNTASDTAILQGLNQSVSSLVGTFGLFQSVVGLADTDNKALQDTIKNLTIVMTALNSLTAIQTALQKESQAMLLINNATTKTAAVLQTLFGVSITGTSTAFKVLRGAIISTGIGALVVGIGLLIANFDKLVGLFKAGEDGVSAFGNAFNKVKEIAMGVYEVIKNYVLMPARAIGKILQGDFSGAFEEIKKGIDVVGNYQKGANAQAVKNAQETAVAKIEADKRALGKKLLNEATYLEKQLEVDKAAGLSAAELHKREMEILEKKKEGYAEALKYIEGKNSDSYKEMAKNLEDINQKIKVSGAAETKRQADDAKKAAKEATTRAKELRKNELDAIREAQDTAYALIKNNQEKELTEAKAASERKIEDLRTRLATEKNLTARAKQEINNTIANLEKQQAFTLEEINKKYADEALAKQVADETAKIELRLELSKKGTEEEFAARKVQLEHQRDIELQNKELTESQKALIAAKYQNQIAANDEAQQKQIADRQAQALANDFASKIQALGNNEQAKAQLILDNEQQKNAALLAMDEETQIKRFGSIEAYKAAVIDSNGKVIEAGKKVKEAQQQSVETQLQAAQTITGAFSDVLTEFAGDNEALAAFAKTIALFNVGLATAEAISKGIAAAQSVPFPGNLPAIATTIASVMANIVKAKQLLSQQKEPKAPKFAQGGLIQGAGSGTSDSIMAKVSSGESIMNALSTSMFAPLLSSLNQIGGGIPIQATQAANQIMGEDMLANAFKKALINMPPSVVSVEEITRVTDRVNVLENLGSV